MEESSSVQELPLIIDGIRLNTVTANIRRPDRKDLVLIELAEGTKVAAVFTQNAFCAAPVQIAKKHLNEASPRYLLINSGNANAGTGQPGIDATVACCSGVAETVQCATNEVLPFSTGVIGEALPVNKITSCLTDLYTGLDTQLWRSASEAIMTTDTVPKLFSAKFDSMDRW